MSIARYQSPYRRQQPRRFSPRIEVLENRLAPAIHTWNGSVNGLWSEPGNWNEGSPAGDPNADLIFPAVAQRTLTNDLSGLTLQSLLFQASDYTVAGLAGTVAQLQAGIRTEYPAGAVVLNTDFQLVQAQTFTVANAGAALTVGGIVSGNAGASLTKDGDGTLSLTNTNTYAAGTTLLQGTLAIASGSGLGPGPIALSFGTLQPTVAMTLPNRITVVGAATIGATNALDLSGLIELARDQSLAFTNTTTTTISGTLNWTGGVLSTSGPLAIGATGLLAVSGNDEKTLSGGPFQNNGACDFGGGGSIWVDKGTQFHNLVGGLVRLLSDIVVLMVSGTSTFLNDGTFSKTSGSGEAMLGAGITFQNNGTLEALSGILNIAGTLANFNSIARTLTGGRFVLRGSLQFTGADIRTNQADLTFDGPDSAVLDENFESGVANLNLNDVNGQLTLLNSVFVDVGGNFDNLGTLTIDSPAGSPGATTLRVATAFIQDTGTTNLSFGSLIVRGVLNLQGGLLTGTGYILGNVVNSGGIINPDGAGGIGSIIIEGNYTQTPNGILALDLAAPGFFDQLVVMGRANLGGTLQVTLLDGFDPNVDDEFQVLLFTDRVGDFDTYDLPALGGGRFFEPVLDGSSLRLLVRQA